MEFRIESLKIKRIEDNDPDLSYLDSSVVSGKIDSCRYSQEDYDKNPEQVEKWIQEDRERVSNSGITWNCIGIIAEAVVSYPCTGDTRRLETFTSSGLWGIDSDSDDSDLEEIEQEQMTELLEHLRVFGIMCDPIRFELVE